MRELKILDRLTIGEKTTLTVDAPCEELKNGSVIFDENGKQHVIYSIATNCRNGGNMNITNIVMAGTFQSEKIFV